MIRAESGNIVGVVAPRKPSLQIVSVLFDGDSSFSTTDASSTTFVEKGSYVSVLADVGHAMAFQAEAGEELNQISVGSLAVQVCSIPAAHNM